jgi:hypothetical protein
MLQRFPGLCARESPRFLCFVEIGRTGDTRLDLIGVNDVLDSHDIRTIGDRRLRALSSRGDCVLFDRRFLRAGLDLSVRFGDVGEAFVLLA